MQGKQPDHRDFARALSYLIDELRFSEWFAINRLEEHQVSVVARCETMSRHTSGSMATHADRLAFARMVLLPTRAVSDLLTNARDQRHATFAHALTWLDANEGCRVKQDIHAYRIVMKRTLRFGATSIEVRISQEAMDYARIDVLAESLNQAKLDLQLDTLARDVIGTNPISARELNSLRRATNVAKIDFRGTTIAHAVIVRIIEISEAQP